MDHSVNDRHAELMPAIILAGGLATRLRPLTESIPKALIEVAGQPFLWHQLELLKKHGVRRVVLSVGYLGEMVQRHFGNGSEFGIEIEYSFDGPVLLGTAGAIRKALPLLPERFFVLYGSSFSVFGRLLFKKAIFPFPNCAMRSSTIFNTTCAIRNLEIISVTRREV